MNVRLTFSVSVVRTIGAAVALGLLLAWTSNVQAQFLPDPMLLDSFEGGSGVGGISDWYNDSPPPTSHDWVGQTVNTNYISHSQSTSGATSGTHSLMLEMNSATGWGVALSVDSTDDSGLYDIFNTVVDDEGAWFVEMDLTIDANSFADTPPPAIPPFQGLWSLNVALGSSDPNSGNFFGQSAATGQLYNVQGQFHVRVPVSNFAQNFPVDSDNYQFFLGSYGNFQVPDPNEGVKVFIDDIRFVPAPPTTSQTQWSWEGGFEGWDDLGLGGTHIRDMNGNFLPAGTPGGHTFAHIDTLVDPSPNATNGTSVLRIDTTIQDPTFNPQDVYGATVPNSADPSGPVVNVPTAGRGYRFYWGTTLALNADTDPDPNSEVINPAIQAQIAALVDKFNSADAVAFDVHFNDVLESQINPFAASTSWARIAVHVADGTGAFFDEEGVAINPPAEGDPNGATFEYVIPTDIMVANCTGNPWCGQSLASYGVQATNTLSIGFSTNGDGAMIVDIDNFRLIFEADLAADFNNDGKVDSDDLPIWEANYGLTVGADKSTGDANLDGAVDGLDLLYWQRTYGIDATNSLVEYIDLGMFRFGGDAAAVPEPASLAMLALGALFVGVRRRRSC